MLSNVGNDEVETQRRASSDVVALVFGTVG